MVELTDANVNEYAVMVEFVHAKAAFIAMFHTHPFRTTTGLFLAELGFESGTGAMVRVAGRIIFENLVVEEKSKEYLWVVEGVGEEEGREDEAVEDEVEGLTSVAH